MGSLELMLTTDNLYIYSIFCLFSFSIPGNNGNVGQIYDMMLNLDENPKGSTNINDALLNAIDTGKKISDIDRRPIPIINF